MTRTTYLKPTYVKAIPEKIDEGRLYISQYGTAVHKCCCGCGYEVVTPLGPTDWKLIKDGSSISLHPSIGSWNLPCRSHYWITRGEVIWADQWTDEQIARARHHENAAKAAYYAPKKKIALWARIWNWLTGRKAG